MVDSAQLVRNLLGEYCERMDLGDFDGVGGLFADAALADEHGTELARGAAAVTAFYQAGTQLHDGSPRTKHLVLNTILELDEEGGHATARSSYLVLQATAGTDLRPIITGRYRDSFARAADGGWHFTERRFLVDLVGDLSHHLRFDLPAPG
jgi:ketosteroid isomerase-like protein